MSSHPRKVGDVFLSPSQRRKYTEERTWAMESMLRYKATGCSITKELLIVFYMQGFVRRSANRIAKNLPSCVDVSDLEQTAYFGLIDCIEKFDPSRKVKFESFAKLRVEGAMRDFLRKEDPVSRVARQRSKKIAGCINQFKTEFGRSPTNEELQNRLHLDDDEFMTLMKNVVVPCTLSLCLVEFDDNDEVGPLGLIEQYDDSLSGVDQLDLRDWLCDQLCTYDKLIVTLHFVENLTMYEVGCVIGYSESRVSQRMKQLLRMLRSRLIDSPDTKLLMAS